MWVTCQIEMISGLCAHYLGGFMKFHKTVRDIIEAQIINW